MVTLRKPCLKGDNQDYISYEKQNTKPSSDDNSRIRQGFSLIKTNQEHPNNTSWYNRTFLEYLLPDWASAV